MGAMASQITSLTIVCATVYSGADQRKRQNSPVAGEFPVQMTSNAEKCFYLMMSSWKWVKCDYQRIANSHHRYNNVGGDQYSDVTWTSWHLQWLATGLLVQRRVLADTAENTKSEHHWALMSQKFSILRRVFTYNDVIIWWDMKNPYMSVIG